MTNGLFSLLDWLSSLHVSHVAIESTGIFWRPIFNLLEGECEVILVNAQHMKAVPGRKTDVRDSEWLTSLLRQGLLAARFIPPKPIRDVRDLVRYRKSLVNQRTQEINRIQKILETANIKLACVASDVVGASGRAILHALIEGITDGPVLAEPACGTLRRKRPQLQEALQGRVDDHHRCLLKHMLAHIDWLERTLEHLQHQIEELLVQTFTMGIYATDPYGFSELQYCTYPKTATCSYTIVYSPSERTDYIKGKHTFRAFLGNIGGNILENSRSMTITWS